MSPNRRSGLIKLSIMVARMTCKLHTLLFKLLGQDHSEGVSLPYSAILAAPLAFELCLEGPSGPSLPGGNSESTSTKFVVTINRQTQMKMEVIGGR